MPILQQSQNSAGGTGQTTASVTPQNSGNAVSAVNPFTKASNQHYENTGYDVTVNLGAGTAPVLPIPAYGFLRGLYLKCTLTATGGTPSYLGDGPFNALTAIQLQEPNGNPIYGQLGTSYDSYLIHKWGGYRAWSDPRSIQGVSITTTSAVFWLRIPIELIERSALGSLPNQNSAAQFQLRWTPNTIAGVYSATTPPTSVTLRVQAFAEEWDQPSSSLLGVPNQTVPPAVNTTQFWSKQSYPIVNGFNTITLNRVGNWIRELIFVTRDTTGTRQNTLIPALTTVTLDAQPLTYFDSSQWAAYMYERTGYHGTADTAGAQDTGVYLYGFNHDFDGQVGYETMKLWQYTVTSSRLQIAGTFGGAGTLDVLTNDVILSEDVFPRS